MNKLELLAPAGDFEKLKTAFYFGADAAYVGGKSLTLRAYAGNFDDAEMERAVKYAHERGKKLYVAVNILARNADLAKAAEYFARVEGILPAPESSHAIKAAIDEAVKCRETGEEKTILFGLTGTGYFDMTAYEQYNDGKMTDYVPTDEEIKASVSCLPKV